MIEAAPRDVAQALARFGGRNLYDQPLWRAVVAETCTRKFGGRLPVYPAGELKTAELVPLPGKRGYLQIPVKVTPLRWEMGPHDILKYPCHGWILERWMPPHTFGNKGDWEAERDAYGDKVNGAFPSEGDYWMMDGPWEKLPSVDQLTAAIARAEYDRANRPVVFELALQQMLKDQEDEAAAQYEKLLAELEHYSRSEIAPLFKRLSLSAQRVRNQVQAALHRHSHLGAGQQ